MRLLACACAVVLAPACSQGAGDDFPVLGGGGAGLGYGLGGGGGGGSGTADAPSGAPFYVCLLSNGPLGTCATTGAAGYTVKLSNGIMMQTTQTDDAGKFYITPPTGNNFVYTVTGADIMTSLELYDNAMYIPILKKTAFATLQANNSASTTTGNGDLFGYLFHNSAPVASLPASTTPATPDQYYDTTSPTVWGHNTATGPLGRVWVPNVPAGLVTLTIDRGAGNFNAYSGIPIQDGALTFFKADF